MHFFALFYQISKIGFLQFAEKLNQVYGKMLDNS